MATQRDDRPAMGTLGVAAGLFGLGWLLLLDLVLGQTYFGVNAPALRVGVLVGATIPLARRHLLLASLAVAAQPRHLLPPSPLVRLEPSAS